MSGNGWKKSCANSRPPTDRPLTGAFNRRYLHSVGRRISPRPARFARPLTLIMFDIDYFKRVKRHLRPRAGRRGAEKNMTLRIRQRLRHSDVLVRWAARNS
ncbi:MAG: diguanylate cyclase [Candidatus Competibacteraceae bacterium]|nr:diguanylate cyclase [Candidatus Competibacteraceae bacterium]